VRICSPHCGIDPETTSGGETYERELLRHLGALGHAVELLLARHKRYPDGVPNWTVHRLPVGRGLRWPVAALLLPPYIRRLYDRPGFDLLRAHSLRFIGPAALIARRRYRLDVPIVAHHHHHLGALGHAVELLLARHKRYPDGVPNWTVHRLPVGRGLRWPVAALLLPPYIRRLYDQPGFDLLRAHSLRFIGPAALIARRRYRLDVPIVAHHHHLDRNWLNPLIEGRVMRAVERVVVGSEFAIRQAAAELGVAREQFSVVPYGVDRRFRRAPKPAALVAQLGLDGKVVALFLGGLKERKNLFFLLDVWREVARAREDARLVVAGSGPLQVPLERYATKLRLDGRVVFAGYVQESAKVEYYNLADLLLFPSAMEGFGLTVAEAMSCELPVVVSDRGSLPELVVDGEGGFLVDGRARRLRGVCPREREGRVLQPRRPPPLSFRDGGVRAHRGRGDVVRAAGRGLRPGFAARARRGRRGRLPRRPVRPRRVRPEDAPPLRRPHAPQEARRRERRARGPALPLGPLCRGHHPGL